MCQKNYFKNISISQKICNERISKVDSLKADCLNSAYDDKFERLLNKDSDFDIDCFLTLDEQYLESCDIESLVYKPLVSFLIRQNFFHKNQFGFRKKYSTSHATMLLVENFTAAFEKKQCMVGIFLDLSKAFDTIDQKMLLQKLMHYGIRGLRLEWFSSYLNDRTQQVLCNNQLSATLKINCGVPQGSILGPLGYCF